MGALAWIFGIIAGLCTVMGIITAVAVIPEVAALTWEFWFMLSVIFVTDCDISAIGRGGETE